MTREAIHTDAIPAAAGPYSAGVKSNGVVYLSGQGPFTPDNELVGTDIASQTHQTLQNLAAIAAAAGTQLDNAVQVRVFLTSMEDFEAMNAVYAEYFNKPYPARTTVQTGLPIARMLVEIDATIAL